jgi:hypothetical protein
MHESGVVGDGVGFLQMRMFWTRGFHLEFSPSPYLVGLAR